MTSSDIPMISVELPGILFNYFARKINNAVLTAKLQRKLKRAAKTKSLPSGMTAVS